MTSKKTTATDKTPLLGSNTTANNSYDTIHNSDIVMDSSSQASDEQSSSLSSTQTTAVTTAGEFQDVFKDLIDSTLQVTAEKWKNPESSPVILSTVNPESSTAKSPPSKKIKDIIGEAIKDAPVLYYIDIDKAGIKEVPVRNFNNLLIAGPFPFLGEFQLKSHTYQLQVPVQLSRKNKNIACEVETKAADGTVQLDWTRIEQMPGRYQSFFQAGETSLRKRGERLINTALSNYRKPLSIKSIALAIAAIIGMIAALLIAAAAAIGFFIYLNRSGLVDLFVTKDKVIYENAQAAFKGMFICGAIAIAAVLIAAGILATILFYLSLTTTLSLIRVIEMHSRMPFQDVARYFVLDKNINLELYGPDELNNFIPYCLRQDPMNNIKPHTIADSKTIDLLLQSVFKKALEDKKPIKVSPQLSSTQPPSENLLATVPATPNPSSASSESSVASRDASLHSRTSSIDTLNTEPKEIIYQAKLAPPSKIIWGIGILNHTGQYENILAGDNQSHRTVLAELKQELKQRAEAKNNASVASDNAPVVRNAEQVIHFTAHSQTMENSFNSLYILGISQDALIARLRQQKANIKYRLILAPIIKSVQEAALKEAPLNIMRAAAQTIDKDINSLAKLSARASINKEFRQSLSLSEENLAELAKLITPSKLLKELQLNDHQRQQLTTIEQALDALSEEAYDNFLKFCGKTDYFSLPLLQLYCAIQQQPLRTWIEAGELNPDSNIQAITLDSSQSYFPEQENTEGQDKKEPIDLLVNGRGVQRLIIQEQPALAPNADNAENQAVDNITEETASVNNLSANKVFNQYGLEIHGVEGDGNCFYHAVALHFDQHVENPNNVLHLRQIAANYIRSDGTLNNMIPSIYGVDGETYAQRVEKVSENASDARSEHADNIQILALMQALGRPIIVMEETANGLNITNKVDYKNLKEQGVFAADAQPIFVYFKPPLSSEPKASGHYEGLTLRPTANAQSILADFGLADHQLASPPVAESAGSNNVANTRPEPNVTTPNLNSHRSSISLFTTKVNTAPQNHNPEGQQSTEEEHKAQTQSQKIEEENQSLSLSP